MKGSLKDGPGRYSSGRRKPQSQKIARSDGTNKQFHKLGLSYRGCAKCRGHKLRDLKQISFPEVCAWSEKRCRDWRGLHAMASSVSDAAENAGAVAAAWLLLGVLSYFAAKIVPAAPIDLVPCIDYKYGHTLCFSLLSGGAGPDCQGLVRGMYVWSTRVPVDVAGAFQQMQNNLATRFPAGVIEFDGMRASFACLLLLCAPTPLLSAPRTSRLQLCFSSVVHVHVTFILHAISLEVAEDFVLALGASLLTALDLFIPDGNFRQHWRASHLLRMLRVTMSCYDIRRTLGPQQSQRELDVLTLSAHVLACVYAREDRVVTVGDCPLPPLVRMPFHQTFRLQVRAWGGAAWRPQLDVLHREVALVLDEVWQRRAIFEHTQGTLHLFLPWRAILEDLSLLVAGLLNHPSTVQDEL
ncbi:unnamed protein product [Symbiodinium natans]|uniref:Uncharacterized protein n=1 Tax=Symbiodinium natans TaxID=878477 RepID=A0A812J7V1_9DINO|nr:unnamed protein product [Symbiodinium natans]